MEDAAKVGSNGPCRGVGESGKVFLRLLPAQTGFGKVAPKFILSRSHFPTFLLISVFVLAAALRQYLYPIVNFRMSFLRALGIEPRLLKPKVMYGFCLLSCPGPY